MTQKQKQIFQVLFEGGHFVMIAPGRFRARDSKCNPIVTFGPNSSYPIYKFSKKKKNVFVLDKKKVLQLHGNNWIKKIYKETRNGIPTLCKPCPPMEVIQSSYKPSL